MLEFGTSSTAPIPIDAGNSSAMDAASFLEETRLPRQSSAPNVSAHSLGIPVLNTSNQPLEFGNTRPDDTQESFAALINVSLEPNFPTAIWLLEC